MTAKKNAKLHKHEKLGIKFVEFAALLAVRELIKGGYVHHVPVAGYAFMSEAEIERTIDGCHLVNMNVAVRRDSHCGAVGCIGGTMAMIMNINPDHYVVRAQGNLNALFFPPRDSKYEDEPSYSAITAKQMLAAIDNFIRTGKANWPKVLKLKLDKARST